MPGTYTRTLYGEETGITDNGGWVTLQVGADEVEIRIPSDRNQPTDIYSVHDLRASGDVAFSLCRRVFTIGNGEPSSIGCSNMEQDIEMCCHCVVCDMDWRIRRDN